MGDVEQHLATKIFLIWKDGLLEIPEYADEINYFRKLLTAPPDVTKEMFFREYSYVVINSGWKQQIANKYHEKFMKSKDPSIFIRHPLKYPALTALLSNCNSWYAKYMESRNKLEYVRSLPMMGGDALGYHLARNLGIDCVKPDRWLIRLSKSFEFKTPYDMCVRVQTDINNSEKLGVIDLVFWRGSNIGLADVIIDRSSKRR